MTSTAPTFPSTASTTKPSTPQSTPSASGPATTGNAALGKLTSNYSDFLKLLMTQLKNQDPTSPMDTNSFTTELVQFSSVEQQINTNTSLAQLIQLTQSGQLLQSSSMVGHTLAVSGADMPVQNGIGQIQFTAAAARPVTVAVYDSVGTLLSDSAVDAKSGLNKWKWNATDANGAKRPDGAYKVVVTGSDTTGASVALPFSVLGQATGVVRNGTALQLQMGAVTTEFSNVQSVLD